METENETSRPKAEVDLPKPWSESLNVLLATSEKSYNTLALQNSKHELEVLLHYFPAMNSHSQLQFLERLINYAEFSDMNKWILFKSNVTRKLLKPLKGTTGQQSSVIERSMRLVEIVCTFSVKVSDVKLMLNMICQKNEEKTEFEESSWYHGLLVKLLYSIAQKENTIDFFYFQGRGSGLLMPTINKFPLNGYSFFTWIKMDSENSFSNGDVSAGDVNSPRLFSLLQESGNGVEAYFEKNELHFLSRKGQEVSKASMSSFKFIQNRWYFIAILHRPPKRGWKSAPSEIKVLIDGGTKWKEKLDYPVDTPSNESFTCCAIGAKVAEKPTRNFDEADSKKNGNRGSLFKNSFCGQMTTIYMVADILKDDQLRSIHALGRNHSTQFLSEQADPAAPTLFDCGLGQKLMLSFHVKASNQEKCLNLAPRNTQSTRDFACGTLVAVEKCSTLSLQSAIRSLGDIEALFPMILRFDYFDSVTHHAPFESQDDFFASESPCRAFFALITALLQNNPKSQSHILKSRGIRVISILLQQIGPRYLSITAFQSMVALANTLSGNEELAREVYTHLVFEFRLWIYASLDIQKYCIEFLKNFCDSRKQMCREIFGVQYFLDVLQTVYWYEQNERSIPHRHAGIGVTRPKSAQLKELRAMVLNIIRGYLKTDITKDETICILRNLSVSDDDVHICEILQLLLDMLLQQQHQSTKLNKDLVENISSYGGFEILCELTKRRRDENVRVYCLKIITLLIKYPTTSEQFTRKLRFEDADPANLTKLLDAVPLTRRIYDALLNWAMERFDLTGLPEYEQEHPHSPGVQGTLENFNIIVTILALLDCDGTKPALQCKILEELVGLFRQNVGYCIRLNQIWCWQRFLVRLIPVHADGQESLPNAKPEDNSKDTADWAVEFLTCVIWNLLSVDKGAFRAAEETIFIIWSSDRTNCLDVIRTFLSSILLLIARNIREAELSTFDAQKLENVIRLICLTEEVIFNHRDISQVIEQKMSSNEQSTELSSSYSSFRSMYESGLPAINALNINDILKPEDMVFQSASNPWEESRTLAEIYLEIVGALDRKAGWRLETIPPNRTDLRPGETCRMVLRILIAGISTPDQVVRDRTLDNLMGFVERHVRTPETIGSADKKHLDDFFCTDSDIFRQHINMLLGEIHETFITSQTMHGSYEHKTVFAYYFFMHKCQSFLPPLTENEFFNETLKSMRTSSKFNEQVFVQFVTSRDWMVIHDKLIVPAMKAANEDDFAIVRRIKESFSKKIGKFLLRSKKEDQNLAKSESAFDIELNDIVQHYKEGEIARGTKLEGDKKNDIERTKRRWLSKLHELTQERGAWSLQRQSRQSEIHWKLDRRENYFRMRRKLTINYDYDTHSDASAKRDKTPITSHRDRNIQKIKRGTDFALSSSPGFNTIDPWTAIRTSSQPLPDESESSEDYEDEEWNLVADDDVVGTSDASTDNPIFSAECEMIVLLSVIRGRIELTTTTISFLVDPGTRLQELNNIEQGSAIVDIDMLRNRKWLLSDIREIYLRKYLLRRSALEFFFTDRTNYFFNFPEPDDRKRLYSHIVSYGPPSMISQKNRSPIAIFKRSNLTSRWLRHEISNFEYLMHLNSIAGRSYNDLSQYPVFPWILADYESETIDLSDPRVYRDLSKPIGALNPGRLAQVLERYEEFDDPSIPKFHYGTHYSSAATVACYLLRLEPFTSVHIALQGGKFDHADRQFHSIKDTWNACLHASGDVRELIPEFFYLPEFLCNHNQFDLGVRQDGTRVDDIILPKWASSPEEFIRIQSEALESDYVSENLHHWIDLIFGYKQNGEEAARAHNLFYHLTYESAINIVDSIDDPTERKSIEQQIYHFGQTPTQLLKEPHPRRLPRRDFVKKDILNSQDNHKQYLVQLISKRLQYIDVSNVDIDPLSNSRVQRIVTIDEEGIIGRHSISPNPATSEIPFSVEVDPTLEYKRLHNRLSSPFCYDAVITPRCFTCSKDGKVLISCGHWENQVKVTLTETGQTIDSLSGHDDVVTTVAVSEDGRILVTGSRSSCVFSWEVNLTNDNEFLNINHTPKNVFYGHDDEITCVAVNGEHDILVSGSKDGTCIVHSLRSSQYVRTLRPLDDTEATVENVCISREGNIIVYAERNDEYFLYTYNINGRLLGTVEISERLNDLIASSVRNYVLISNARRIALFDCLWLQLRYEFEIPLVARSITLSQDASQIYFCGGGDDGKILIIQSHVNPDLQ